MVLVYQSIVEEDYPSRVRLKKGCASRRWRNTMQARSVCRPQFSGKQKDPWLWGRPSHHHRHQHPQNRPWKACRTAGRKQTGLGWLRSLISLISILISAWTQLLFIVRIKSLTNVEASYKCLDNFLGFVSQTYYGLPVVSHPGKGRTEKMEAALNSANLKQNTSL